MRDNQLPKAYRVGIQDFYGRDFVVSQDVLIPRPETEMMVDAILSLAGVPILSGVMAPKAQIPRDAKILEVGTGSGCVAISLQLALPKASVVATDISDAALVVAKENAQRLGARVEFYQSDLLENVHDEYDVICANLPYVDQNWGWLDKKALSVEPELALYAEEGGLALVKRLIREIDHKCRFLVLEADPVQHLEIIKYASDFSLKHIRTRGFILEFKLI